MRALKSLTINNTKFGSLALATALVLTAAFTGQACAATLLYDAVSTNIGLYATDNYSNGSEFTITGAMELEGLSYIDAQGDGLITSHVVTLWNTATQTLVASATVTPSSSYIASANGVSRWYYEAVTPLTLGAGTYRVVGLQEDDDYGLNSTATPLTGAASVSAGYVRNDYPNGGTAYPHLNYPSTILKTNVLVTVPEPSAALLGALGALGLLRRRR